MFKFHCHGCGQTFNIAFEMLYNKDEIKCQNCGLTVPEEAVVAFNKMSENYMDAVDILKSKGEYQNGWSITILEITDPIPEPKNEFSLFDRDSNKSFWNHRKKLQEQLEYEQMKRERELNPALTEDDDLPY